MRSNQGAAMTTILARFLRWMADRLDRRAQTNRGGGNGEE